MVAQNPFLQSALAYAAAGFRVFPCLAGHKEPAWKWVEEATRDPERLTSWWQNLPEANLAAVTDDQWLILDIDHKPGKPNGYETLKDILPHLPPTFTVTTPNRGEHRYFRKPPDWQPARRRGQGYDIQTGNAYVLVPPSRVSVGFYMGEYRVVDWSPIAALPEVLKVFLDSGGGGPRVSEPDAGLPPELDRAELDACWPDVSGWPERVRWWWDDGDASGYDSRSEAVNGLAWHLYQQSLTDEQVMGVLWEHYWTQRAALEHRRGDPVKARGWLWLSCLKTRGDRKPSADEVFEVQERTPAGESVQAVFQRLRQQIEDMPEKDLEGVQRVIAELAVQELDPVPTDILLAALKAKSGVGLTALRAQLKRASPPARRVAAADLGQLGDYTFIAELGVFYDTVRHGFYTRENVRDLFAHEAPEDTSAAELVAGYLKDSRSKVHRLTYRPEEPTGARLLEDGKVCLNIARPFALEPLEGDWGPYMELFRMMQIDDTDRDHVLDYFAYMLQKPGRHIRHALVIGGRETGTGKDSLIDPLRMILGDYNWVEVGGDLLGSTFNSYLQNKRLAIVQEANAGEHRSSEAIENRLKPWISQDTLMIHPKGLNPFNIQNCVQFILTTNEEHPLHLSDTDRRNAMVWVGLVYHSEEDRQRYNRWWNEFHGWLKGGESYGARVIMGQLLERDVSHFDPNTAPRRSEWHGRVVDASRGELEARLMECIEEGVGIFAHPVFTLEHAYVTVRAAHPEPLENGRQPNSFGVRKALRKLGYTPVRFQGGHRKERESLYLYVPKGGLPSPWRELSGTDVIARYYHEVKRVPELQKPGNVTPFPGGSEEDPEES